MGYCCLCMQVEIVMAYAELVFGSLGNVAAASDVFVAVGFDAA